MSAVKIDKKIQGFKVAGTATGRIAAPELEAIHEGMARPDVLIGKSYKIKTPDSEHAVYITINDAVLNAGTEHESKAPFEIFLNTKNPENFQWTSALTRIISAVFRKGGNVAFLADELKAVHDPRGGHFKKGHGYVPSLVAEIGMVLQEHLSTGEKQ
jgi:hypothetical protein